MLEQLRTLAYFTHINTIVPITSGLSSQCYQVNADNTVFFAKKILTGETQVTLLAAAQGISPKVVYHDQHWLISQFITCENLSQSQCCVDEKITIAIKLMTQCHQISATPSMFVPKAIVQGLINQEHFSTQQQLELRQVAKQLLSQLNLAQPSNTHKNVVCCHGDLNFSNILVDQKKNTWLVDYECASMAPAEYDLAMFIAINNLPESSATNIIEQYQQYCSVDIELALLNRYLIFCYFINGLWYYNQHQSHNLNAKKLLSLAKQQWQYIDKDIATTHKMVELFRRLGIKL